MSVFLLVRRVTSLFIAVAALCVSYAWAAIGKAGAPGYPPANDLYVVRGVTVTPSGEPIGQAYVKCVLAGKPSWGQGVGSKASGRFEIRLKAGRYEMWVQGAKINRVEVVVGPGSPAAVKITGRADKHIMLTFQKPDGTPAAGLVISTSISRLRTDEAGRARFRVSFDAPSRVFLVAPNAGYYGEFGFEDDSQLYSTSSLTVRLHAGGTVAGTVRDGKGRPLGGQELYPILKVSTDAKWESFWNARLENECKGVHVAVGSVSVVSRDGDGEYLIRGLIPGDYELRMGYYPGEVVGRFSINDGKSIQIPDTIAPSQPRARRISGRVLHGTARKPIANTEVVFVTRSDQTWSGGEIWHYVKRRFVTDSRGRFSLYPLEPWVYWIAAAAPAYGVSERLTVDVSRRREANVDVVLTGGARR